MGEKYYYNLATGAVEFGKLSRGFGRMGPYDTIEDARDALAAARERNDAWEDADDEWKKEWDDDAWSPEDNPQDS